MSKILSISSTLPATEKSIEKDITNYFNEVCKDEQVNSIVVEMFEEGEHYKRIAQYINNNIHLGKELVEKEITGYIRYYFTFCICFQSMSEEVI